MEQFLGPSLLQNLAILFQIPLSTIKVVQVNPGSTAVTVEIRDTQPTVLVQPGDNATSTAAAAQLARMQALASQIGVLAASGQLAQIGPYTVRGEGGRGVGERCMGCTRALVAAPSCISRSSSTPPALPPDAHAAHPTPLPPSIPPVQVMSMTMLPPIASTASVDPSVPSSGGLISLPVAPAAGSGGAATSGGSGGLTAGAIAGIAVGAIFGAALLAGVAVVLVLQRRRQSDALLKRRSVLSSKAPQQLAVGVAGEGETEGASMHTSVLAISPTNRLAAAGATVKRSPLHRPASERRAFSAVGARGEEGEDGESPTNLVLSAADDEAGVGNAKASAADAVIGASV